MEELSNKYAHKSHTRDHLRAGLVELHFLILRRSDSDGKQAGEHVRINSEVIPTTNE